MSQSDTPRSSLSKKVDNRRIRRIAKYAWLLPLIGLAIAWALWYAGFTLNDSCRLMAGGFTILGCLGVGWLLTVASWLCAFRYRGVLRHAIGGTVVCAGLSLLYLFAVVVASSINTDRHDLPNKQTARQLKLIYAVMGAYAMKHGRYPDSYDQLVQSELIPVRMLVMPHQRPPDEFAVWSTEQQIRWAVDNCPYRFPILGKKPEDTKNWHVVGYMPVWPYVSATKYFVIAPWPLGESGPMVEDKVVVEDKLKQQGLAMEKGLGGFRSPKLYP